MTGVIGHCCTQPNHLWVTCIRQQAIVDIYVNPRYHMGFLPEGKFPKTTMGALLLLFIVQQGHLKIGVTAYTSSAEVHL